uniref:Vacuolar cation/proton exchanger n=1 Tax=Salix viminalis TaxID=40686 RepID=A0A6N2L2F3_SALVM
MDQYYSQVHHQVSSDLENGDVNYKVGLNSNSMKEVSVNGKTPQNISSSIVRKKSDPVLVSSNVRFQMLGYFLTNLQEVILGTKLAVLFPAIPLAIAADYYKLGRPWIFALSLLGLTPLAERVSFLTEQIAYFTGPTVGGLLNATCGNATELIIAILALYQNKIHVLKYSLLGSILSNLLLVLGTSLLCGGLANLKKEQRYDRKQADVNSLLLLLGLLCHMLPLMFRYAIGEGTATDFSTLEMSRASSIIMLIAYVAYIFFQLKTHRQLFDSQEEGDEEEEKAEIGFWSAFTWLAGMTIIIALLSEYVVGTIEAASDSWGISVSFLSIILLPIVGNAAEHAGSVIFALKNKLDISLGVALGSATQISMFVVPLCVVVAWTMNIQMDLDFSLLETGSLAFTIIITAFTLQDGTSHYLKGLLLFLCYIVIAACFFVHKIPQSKESDNGAAANCVAIIFGVTGLVGREIARRLISKNKWKVYGVARRSESFPILSPSYRFISCDLLNPNETEKKLSLAQDVTHMFWVTWTSEFPLDSRECCEQNEAMMSNALNVILAKSKALKHVSLQTGMKHYLSLRGPFDDEKEESIYDETCPRASEGFNFYYVLEDLAQEETGW